MKERDFKSLEYNKIKDKVSEKCVTYLGKELVKELIPSTEIYRVKRWQKETTEAVSILLRKGEAPLFSVPNFDETFKKINVVAMLNMKELLQIATLLSNMKRLKNYFKNDDINDSEFEIISEYFENLYSNPNVENEIFRCIKSEELMDDRASKALYDIRRQINDSESKIKEKLNNLIKSSTTSKYLQDAVVTFRNDRYVIPIKQEYRNEIPGLVHDSSASGNTIFVEPTAVFNINNEIKELKIKEQLEIERILALLTQMVLPIVDDIKRGLYNLSKIDFAFAKAKYSLELNAFEPVINEKHYINLKKARHPLIAEEKVVPIDIWVGEKFNVLIITGPNTGGKTVALKTVGLFSLMAQSGLHIPAMESSELPIFDNIYSDIGDEQSIEQSLSTFSSHMINVVDILNNVTMNSLVLVDELGSGTDPIEGAALARAILEKLYGVGCLTIATTHYSELKTFAIQKNGVENASCEFDVESLRPTYKLLIGVPGRSNAFAISKKLGLSEEIINEASKYLKEEDVRFEDVLGNIERDKRLAREQKEEADRILNAAKAKKEKVDEAEEKLNKKKDEILQKAKKEARDLLMDTEEEANEIIKELTNLKHSKDKDKFKKAEEARGKIKNNIFEMQKDLVMPGKETKNKIEPSKIKVGMNVYIPSLEEDAVVLSLPDKKGNVQIQVGILKMGVHISKIEEAKKDEKKANVKVTSMIKSKAAGISTEIKLLGKTVDEAVEELDKYIDDAYLAGLHTLRVVHGKGTGSLRKGVQEYLKTNSHVKSYRSGAYGEGDLRSNNS